MKFSALTEKWNNGGHGRSNWIILLLLGVLLMVVVWPGSSNSDTDSDSAAGADASSDNEQSAYAGSEEWEDGESEYVKRLEEDLTAILETMAGVGEVRVMITLQDTGETILEKDYSSSTDTSSDSTVILEQDGNEVPYVTGQTFPGVQGVVVVAQGAGTGSISTDITDTVMALFGIEAHRVKVLPMG